MRPPLTIDRSQRDTLGWQILDDLTGLADLHVALSQGRVKEARELRQRYGGELRLLDDLGWGDADPGDEFAITMQRVELVPTLRRLCELTADSTRAHLSNHALELDAAREAADASEIVGDLLSQIAERCPDDGPVGR